MKAKEYNKQFIKLLETETVDKAIFETFKNMFLEVQEIRYKRKAKSNDAIISIFNEMNLKGNSFVRLANKSKNVGLVKDAFKKYVIIRSPDFAKMIGWS